MGGELLAFQVLTHLLCVDLSRSELWAAFVLGMKPPYLFLLPVQMPKLCAAAEFELLETN